MKSDKAIHCGSQMYMVVYMEEVLILEKFMLKVSSLSDKAEHLFSLDK